MIFQILHSAIKRWKSLQNQFANKDCFYLISLLKFVQDIIFFLVTSTNIFSLVLLILNTHISFLQQTLKIIDIIYQRMEIILKKSISLFIFNFAMTLSLVILIRITLLMEKQADQNLVPCYRLIVIDWNISKDLKF